MGIPWTFSYRVARAPCVPFSQLSSCASDTFPKHQMFMFQKPIELTNCQCGFNISQHPRKNHANNLMIILLDGISNLKRAWNNQQFRSQKWCNWAFWGNLNRWLHISVAITHSETATGRYQASGTAGHVSQLRQRWIGKMCQGGSKARSAWEGKDWALCNIWGSMGIKCKPKKSNSDQWTSTNSSLHLKKLQRTQRISSQSMETGQFEPGHISWCETKQFWPRNEHSQSKGSFLLGISVGQKIATCWWIMVYLGIRNHSNAFMKGTPSGPAFHNLLSKMLDIETSSWAEPWGYPLQHWITMDHYGSTSKVASNGPNHLGLSFVVDPKIEPRDSSMRATWKNAVIVPPYPLVRQVSHARHTCYWPRMFPSAAVHSFEVGSPDLAASACDPWRGFPESGETTMPCVLPVITLAHRTSRVNFYGSC